MELNTIKYISKEQRLVLYLDEKCLNGNPSVLRMNSPCDRSGNLGYGKQFDRSDVGYFGCLCVQYNFICTAGLFQNSF